MTPRSLAVLFAVAATTVLAGCQTAAPTRDYTAFVRAAPRSILVVPPLNKSTDLNASYGFLSTVTQPLAEHGYYVFPVAVVDEMFRQNGLPTAAEIHAVAMDRCKKEERPICWHRIPASSWRLKEGTRPHGATWNWTRSTHEPGR